MQNERIRASELCSRRLWQIVSGLERERFSETELSEAIDELSRRRRYLEELQELGKLEGREQH